MFLASISILIVFVKQSTKHPKLPLTFHFTLIFLFCFYSSEYRLFLCLSYMRKTTQHHHWFLFFVRTTIPLVFVTFILPSISTNPPFPVFVISPSLSSIFCVHSLFWLGFLRIRCRFWRIWASYFTDLASYFMMIRDDPGPSFGGMYLKP